MFCAATSRPLCDFGVVDSVGSSATVLNALDVGYKLSATNAHETVRLRPRVQIFHWHVTGIVSAPTVNRVWEM